MLYCHTMTHQAPITDHAAIGSKFSQACDDIIRGRIRMFGDLTAAELEAGDTDCAMAFVGFDYPHFLGIAVLRGGKVGLRCSYRASASMVWGNDRPRPFGWSMEATDKFMAALSATVLRAEEAGLVMLQGPMALAAVREFARPEHADGH
jgi:hypothetical protein